MRSSLRHPRPGSGALEHRSFGAFGLDRNRTLQSTRKGLRRAQPRATGFFLNATAVCAFLAIISQLPPAAGPRAVLRGGMAPLESAAVAL